MAIDAFDMAIVHRVFRDEFRHLPSLIREVSAGDMRRSAIVASSSYLRILVAQSM